MSIEGIRLKIDRIIYQNSVVDLSIPIELYVSKKGKTFQVTSEELLMWGQGYSLDEALDEFYSLAIDNIGFAERFGRGSNQYLDALMHHVEGS